MSVGAAALGLNERPVAALIAVELSDDEGDSLSGWREWRAVV
jgi:hypothetical protein